MLAFGGEPGPGDNEKARLQAEKGYFSFRSFAGGF